MLITYNLAVTKLGFGRPFEAYGVDCTFNVNDNPVYTLKQTGTNPQTYSYLYTNQAAKKTKERI